MGNVNRNYSNAFNSRALLLFQDKPEMEYWLREVNIPSINLGEEEIAKEP